MMGTMWFNWLFGIALVLMLIWAVVQVFNNSSSQQRGSADDEAVEILCRRLARGEINEDEFEEKLMLLKQ